VADLGSVFEADDGQPKGPDLRVTVEVPRAALGASLLAPVPMRLAANGELIERVVVGEDQPGLLTLHLPEVLPSGAVLRLRGQGGCGVEGQRPGDLFVVIELVDRPPRGDERILHSAIVPRASASVATREGNDITWWLLGGLAVLCAAVLVALFSL
jgi:hypothetical protein